MDNLQPDKQSELQYFSPSDLAALDSEGFILRDGFLSSQEQIEAIRDEVRLRSSLNRSLISKLGK